MRPRNRLARLFRALSGETQKDFAERTGVDLSLLARYELDQVEPGLDHLARLAEGAGLTLADGEQVLRLVDTLRDPRRRTGAGIEDLGPELSAALAGTYQRLLRLAPPAAPHQAEDREHANDLWARLEPLPEDEQLAVVRVACEFQKLGAARTRLPGIARGFPRIRAGCLSGAARPGDRRPGPLAGGVAHRHGDQQPPGFGGSAIRIAACRSRECQFPSLYGMQVRYDGL